VAYILRRDECKYAEEKENTKLHSAEKKKQLPREGWTIGGQIPQEQLAALLNIIIPICPITALVGPRQPNKKKTA